MSRMESSCSSARLMSEPFLTNASPLTVSLPARNVALLDDGRCKSKRAAERFDVAIAGGGFAGRTLALALAKLAPQGFRIALVDAEPAQAGTASDARALALSAATQNLLAVLESVAGACAQRRKPSSDRDHRQPAGRRLRPHFLGFDDELKAGAPGAYRRARRPARVLAAAVGENNAIDAVRAGRSPTTRPTPSTSR